MTNFATKADTALRHAMSGNLNALASYLESGGEVSHEIRDFLVSYLRKGLNFGPGNRRTYAQVSMELGIISDITTAMRHFGISRYKATKVYLAINPHLNEETIKSYLKKNSAVAEKVALPLDGSFQPWLRDYHLSAGRTSEEANEFARAAIEGLDDFLNEFKEVLDFLG